MTMIDATELAAMRTAATAAMCDLCKIGTRGMPTGTDPNAVTWTWGSAVNCGVRIITKGEMADGSHATMTTVELRLPWGTAINSSSRIHLTSKHGETVSEYYAVIGSPYAHIANIRVNLQRLTGESAL